MSSTAGASNDGANGGPVRYFAGEDEDPKEYRRWKTWVQNKLLTMDKLPKEAKGAYIYTLLAGKALECVEHLDASAYQCAEGEKELWRLLDLRFPQKDKTDEMGEMLGEVFSLHAKDQESLKSWVARGSEIFDRCQRKTNVTFPSEARGWVLLHRAGLSEEQKAVVLARASGSLKRDDISTALRSCYPDLVVKTKKTFGAHAVIPEMPIGDEPIDDDVAFSDVELLLAEHDFDGESLPEDAEAFDETEVAEVLAATWREKRAELNKLQKTRKFSAAKDLKRSFRIEVEELKKRTTCHRCGKQGHWSRECRQPRVDSKHGKGPQTSSTASGAGLVQAADYELNPENDVHFVAAISVENDMLQSLRARLKDGPKPVMLVSSPGYGVLDSGCGKTIVGRETLRSFEDLWKAHNVKVPAWLPERNTFRFGNGQTELSQFKVPMPVQLAGKKGVIMASIVRGSAPLLISRNALQALHANIDFFNNEIALFPEQKRVPLKCNEAGQYVLPVLGDEDAAPMSKEMVTDDHFEPPSVDDNEDLPCAEVTTQDRPGPGGSDKEIIVTPEVDSPEDKPNHVPGEKSQSRKWTREDWGARHTAIYSSGGPAWDRVFRRIVRRGDNHKILFDDAIDHSKPKRSYVRSIPNEVCHVVTEFHYTGDEIIPNPQCSLLSAKQCRQLQKSVSQCHAVQTAKPSCSNRRLMVVEVFSPPRFSKVCQQAGFRAKNYDLITGQDLSVPSTRRELEQHLVEDPPDLLILCPPCTDEGGWFHLNSTKWDRLEYLQRVQRSRSYIRFCVKLFKIQVSKGGRALFEHPTGAKTWSYPEMKTLCRQYHVAKCHMCMYGLRLPNSDKYLRKSTRLLVSHEDMLCLGVTCPGNTHDRDVVAGSHPKVGSVSRFAGQYTDEFVHAVLRTVPAFREKPVYCLEVLDDVTTETQWNGVQSECEVLMIDAKKSVSDQDIKQLLHKVHKNLGHPTNADLVRILKHAQANSRAIEMARTFRCETCASRAPPKTALPAQTGRVVDFNHRIGIDVKHLPGWKHNQKVKALNIVDYASGYQRMIPFFETETSQVLWNLLNQHWFAWAGPPREIILDPAATNLGEPMMIPMDTLGVVVHPIAAGAHYQMGKVESHGGWFEKVLAKIVTDHSPHDQPTWLECVHHAHIKNQMLQHHGVTPCQFVFGQNPRIPSDLLNEPLDLTAATASLQSTAIARTQAIRTFAREAVIQLQDNRALRLALAARPRVDIDFKPGDHVAYWRNQKWIAGKLQLGGQWYGTAIVIGRLGRNYLIVHRKQLLRVAPEQLRPATSEERTLAQTPEIDLLGIKTMIEQNQFKNNQFLDLTQQSYPSGTPELLQEAVSSEFPTAAENVPDSTNPPPAINPSNVEINQPPPLVTPPNPPDNPPEHNPPVPATMSGDATATAEPSISTNAEATDGGYGPVRRRVTGKSGDGAMWRPPALREDDFVSIMKEVVPKLIVEMPMGQSSSAEASTDVSMPSPVKRDSTQIASPRTEPSSSSRQRTQSPAHETLSVQVLRECDSVEALIAAYLKNSKEIPHSNNSPDLQKKVDLGKYEEWKTTVSKPNAVKLHYGKEAQKIRETQSHRFIGSRFVITRKPMSEETAVDPNDLNSFSVKGRWCLQGHLDPDLEQKALDGKLKSPTLSQLSRMILMQIISSKQWNLQLGDIKGAFLEAEPLADKYRPLYADQPPGGIPGVPPSAVIEVLGNIYGQNDAPASWYNTFKDEAVRGGWKQSKFDNCLFTLRSSLDNRLIGIMGVHVDDTALGGEDCDEFRKAVAALRTRFPYRKWRVNQGEFCGAYYTQSTTSKEIVMDMKKFTDTLRPAYIKKGVNPEQKLDAFQIKQLRGINGSLNWLSSQARPDVAAQTSLSQQVFPDPKIKHLRQANNVVRRARMHRDLSLTFKSIPVDELTIVCHSDAAFANVGTHTQAGHILAFTSKHLQDGKVTWWCPATWRSHKLSRAVSSTLAAESQSMSIATGTVEWMSLILTECLDGSFSMHECRDMLARRPPLIVTDCQSLYDHLTSPSAPTAVEDRRTSIDITIIRESIKATQAFVRWVPTNRMLADGLTKDLGDPMDLMRSCIRNATYQISP